MGVGVKRRRRRHGAGDKVPRGSPQLLLNFRRARPCEDAKKENAGEDGEARDEDAEAGSEEGDEQGAEEDDKETMDELAAKRARFADFAGV